METLVEDFLQYSRSERGQAEHTQRTYNALLMRCVAWARGQGISDWHDVQLKHLTEFLLHEQTRPRRAGRPPRDASKKTTAPAPQ